MITEAFRENVKRLRQERKLSQWKFAELIGRSRKTYMKYENGSGSPSMDMAEDMATAIGVEFGDMIADRFGEYSELKRKAAAWDKVLEYAREAADVGYTRIKIEFIERLEGGDGRTDDD